MSAACSNCGEPHGPEDVFCENCGLDFLTGTLPDPVAPVTSIGGAGQSPPLVAGGAEEVLTISPDPAFHARMDTDGVLSYPDPEPAVRTIPLVDTTVLIGRERASRGIFPDVDVASDPAVSSRHAVLTRRPDGSWTVTDLGSTNGTYLGDSSTPIEPHRPVPVPDGTPVLVGAWTRIDITRTPGAA